MKLIYTILIQLFVLNLTFANASKLTNYNLPISNTDDIQYLLPKTSKPDHYEIYLNINLQTDNINYDGYVEINITVLETTDTLILHADGEQIDNDLSYLKYGLEQINIIDFNTNEINSFLTLQLEKSIKPDKYTLILVFKQKYFQQAGLILQTYKSLTGEIQYMLGTYFQPVYARRIIPCYDEPNFKATFKMIVFHPKKYNAVSNTEIEESQLIEGEGNIRTVFKTTPKMSTYLLALFVSEYEALETKFNGTQIKAYVPNHQLQQTRFILNITHDSLKFYEDLFQIKYNLSKLDSILLPTFGGGMENWGLIVYGKKMLVDKEDITKLTEVMGTGELICHEVAHQWFGNLVTLDWWDYTWLNEGFAMYYSQICGDKMLGNNKTVRFMDKHIISLQHLLQTDSDPGSAKSLNKHAETPNSIHGKFDDFSYKKGAAIVRFMSLIIPNFDKAITNYLNRFQYGNVKPKDLFNVMDETANTKLLMGVNVQKIMKNWINLPGYPLITCNVTKRDDISIVTIKQEQFNTNPNKNVSGKWWIPIMLVNQNNPNFNKFKTTYWLTDSSKSITMYVDNIQSGWVILNPQRTVFARVNYDLENWRRIINYLRGPNFEKIHPINRAQLIDDAHNLAQINKLPQEIVLDLLSYLCQEKDQLVRDAASNVLRIYGQLLKDTPALPRYMSFITHIYGEKEAENLLSPPDYKALTESAYIAFVHNKQSNFLETIGKLTSRLFAEEDLITTILSSGVYARTADKVNYQPEFNNQIKIRFEQNLRIKKNFMKKYDDINQWLMRRY